MRCSQIQTAISAELDDEPPPIPRAEVGCHLTHCPACRQYQTAARTLQRRTRVRPAPAVPDLTGRVVAAITAAPSHELGHAVEVIGLIGLWLLARTPSTGRARLAAA